ncbi:MAG TPA: hypothetical protein VF841_08040 [Anaeromyxobacter sp.]
MLVPALLSAILSAAPAPVTSAVPPPPKALAAAAERARAALLRRYGEAERARIDRGVAQAAAFWRPSGARPDGDARAFEAFCVEQFLPRGPALDATFDRLEAALEAIDGHDVEIDRELSRWAQLDVGPEQPVDGLLDALDPAAHVTDDLFDGKVAFVALLDFPLTTLDERLARGDAWSRREWAEARLANRFARRVPAEVNQGIARAAAHADAYVADYNLYMHHVLSEKGERLFPKGKRLLSHWNLRDELKAQYEQDGGLARQRVIAKAMDRIVTQTIPAAVVNDPAVDWNPFTNEVRPAPPETIEEGGARGKPDPAREPDTRYARILESFRAVKAADPYSPSAPTYIARTFDLQREIPEEKVVAMLEEVLAAPELPALAKVISAKLGRPLQPFDLWYSGFRPRSTRSEAELDTITRQRYPTAEAFAKALPDTLQKLGFSAEKARWLADRIEVDPARGSGHALGAARRGDKPHLRTRVGKDGMDYKGFNIAIHELGHNVEQVFSLYEVDHTLLQGVPNVAFTEALAFVFQARDLDVLGLGAPDPAAKRLAALNDLWAAAEISAVGLVDLGMWHWMYDHPRATPAELREATVRIAKDVWNRWWAPLVGVRDSPILAIYSHLVNAQLYLPDYPIGHLIAAQIEEHVDALPAGKTLGEEFERMAAFGAVAPDLWMRHATGEPVSPRALLRAARKALEETAAR